MPLHTCQTCGEAWSGRYIAEHPDEFDLKGGTMEVQSCPVCRISDDEVETVTEDHDMTTDDIT